MTGATYRRRLESLEAAQKDLEKCRRAAKMFPASPRVHKALRIAIQVEAAARRLADMADAELAEQSAAMTGERG